MKQHFIDNASVPGSSGERIPVIDPSTGQEFDSIARGNAADIDLAVQAARRAYEGAWGRLSAAERGRLMLALSLKVLEHRDELTALESRDCGKPLKQARADVIAIARYFEYYGGAADKLHGETIPYQQGYTVLTLREPHGVTGTWCPGTTPCRSSGAASAPRWRPATPAWSSPPRTPACRCCAWPNWPQKPAFPPGRSIS